MTRQDKWKKRPCVVNYWAFVDECKLKRLTFPASGADITFVIPMPKSWSNKEKIKMDGQPHIHKPDLSNLLKALEDAVYKNDSMIWNYKSLTKIWGYTGMIIIN